MVLMRREKKLLLSLTAFLACGVVYAFAVKPALERIQTLNRVIPEKQMQLQQLRVKCRQYVELQKKLSRMQNNTSPREQQNFKLLPFIESLIKKSYLPEKVVKIKQYSAQLDADHYETVAQIRLEKMRLDELVDLLSRLRQSPVPVKIKTLQIKINASDPGLLDSVVEIHNLKPTGIEAEST